MKLIDFPHMFVLHDTMQKTRDFDDKCLNHAKNKREILIIKTSGFAGFNIKIYEILNPRIMDFRITQKIIF